MSRKKDQLPISVDAYENLMRPFMKESAQALIAAEPVYASQNIIRLKAGEFMLNEEKLKKPLQLVILGWSYGQFYYEDEYDPDNRQPPVCFALARNANELAPDPTSPKKQHDGLCATCKQNAPKSSPKGGFGRACNGRRRVAVLFVNDRSADPQIGSLEISPAGLAKFSAFLKSTVGIYGGGLTKDDLALMVTEFDTEASRKGQGAQFIVARPLGLLVRTRPDWVTPPKGVKLQGKDWIWDTFVGRKVREVADSKMLLVPPSLTAEPVKPRRPVTGAKRVSVKEAKKMRARA